MLLLKVTCEYVLTLGSLLGCGITDFCSPSGAHLSGANRLFTVYFIWKLRCEWRIQRDRVHSETEIHNRWLEMINSRLNLDCASTNELRYGRKALPSALVQRTWACTFHDKLRRAHLLQLQLLFR
jgi:hypothetical protein